MNEKYLLIAVEESDSSIGFYDASTGNEVARVKTGLWPHEIEISRDGTTAYVTNFGVKDYDERIGQPGASISIIDLRYFCEVGRLYTFRNKNEYLRFRGPHGVKISPDGNQLYVNVETDDRLLIYNINNEFNLQGFVETIALENKIVETKVDSFYDVDLTLPAGTHNMLFSEDGKFLYVTAGVGGVTEIDVETKKQTRTFYCNGAVRGLTYTIDKQQLIASASNEVCLVNPTTFQITKRFLHLGAKQILNSAPTPDGKYILSPAVWEGCLLVINIQTGEVERRIIVGTDPIHILIHPNRSAFITSGRSKYLTEIDLGTYEIVKKIRTKGGPNGMACIQYKEPAQKKKLRFGVCLPLSGPSGEEGQDLRLGYQFWEEKVNNSGGILIEDTVYEIEIIYRDSGSKIEREEIQSITRELIEIDNVNFLLGNYPSAANLHSGEIANNSKIPFITASGAAEDIYNMGYKYVFGIMSSSKSFLEGALRLLESKGLLPKSICFISCDDIAAINDAKTTANIARELHMEILTPKLQDKSDAFTIVDPGIIVFKHFRTDFESIINAVKPLKADFIIQTGHLGEAIGVIKRSEEERFVPKGFAFSVGPAFPAFSQTLKDLSLNILGAAMWSSVQESYGHDPFITPKNFEKEFYNRFSKKPSYLSAGAMACGLVYEEAFRRAKSKNPVNVIDALRSKDFEMQTFYSSISFDNRGLNVKRPLIIIQLREVDGEIKHIPVWPPELAGNNELVWPFPGWKKSEMF
jgi:ABC-type branched-subunit amino acid transport system substrate-binding protein/DNA-binding beta-propeller fold protein YncE